MLDASKQLCKNKYFAELIRTRKVCAGMTPTQVESAWGPAWLIDGNTYYWGNSSSYHSHVIFKDGLVEEIFTDFLDRGSPGYIKR